MLAGRSLGELRPIQRVPGRQTAVHTGSRERRRPDLRAADPGAAVSAVKGGLIVVEELIAHARAAFGWYGGIEVSAGPRAASHHRAPRRDRL